MTTLPTGTVTFLMTDIEGSTRLAASAATRFAALLDEHFTLLDAAVKANGGTAVSSEGDALFAVFSSARQGIAAAIDAQRALGGHEWPNDAVIKVRMGVHAGEAVFGGRDYTGLEVHRTARIAAAAWGGEILVSEAVRALAGDNLPDGATLRDLGRHGLRDLPAPEHLFQLCAPGLESDFPPPRTMTVAVRTNLPSPLTRFVGRRRELAELRALLERERSVTLTGPGGTGKTRLAIETARSLLDGYPDGVWFVALDIVRDRALVIPTVARTLAVAEQPGRSIAEVLAEHLAEQQVLIVLDNLEQVVDAAPDIAALLTATTRLAVLSSSREPLGIAGERVYPVPVLGLPSEPGRPTAADIADSDSVELFVERARAARPNFALTDVNAPAVAAICRRLDGLPLAIELAAARINLIAPAQILDRLDHRLNLVTSTRRDLPDRQRTLRGAIDWSHDLLAEPERAVFRRLSVFAGGADLDAVLAIVDPAGELAGDPLDLLAALVDRSLVRSAQDGDEARFEMLETIREYAAEKLTEAGEERLIRDRHMSHFAALAEASDHVLTQPNSEANLARLDLEMANLRAAFAWSVASGAHDAGFRMAAGLRDFWRTRSHLTEARRALDELIEESSNDELSVERGDALGVAAELAAWHTDYARAQELTEQWIAMLEQLGDQQRLGQALGGTGWANLVARPEVARDAFRQSVALSGEADGRARMGSLQGLSLALFRVGELDEARVVAQQAVDLGEQLGDAHTSAMNYLSMGMIELGSDNEPAAARYFVEGLHRAHAVGAKIGIELALDVIALVAIRHGETATAARLGTVAERLRREMGGGPSADLIGLEGPVVQARAALEPADFERAVAEGDAMSVDTAAQLALAVATAASEGRPDERPVR